MNNLLLIRAVQELPLGIDLRLFIFQPQGCSRAAAFKTSKNLWVLCVSATQVSAMLGNEHDTPLLSKANLASCIWYLSLTQCELEGLGLARANVVSLKLNGHSHPRLM